MISSCFFIKRCKIIVLCIARYYYLTYFCVKQRTKGYECRQCTLTNAQGDAGILHLVVASQGGFVCFRHHFEAKGSTPHRGGRYTLSIAYPLEERQSPGIRMGRVQSGTSTQILFTHCGRRNFPARIGRSME